MLVNNESRKMVSKKNNPLHSLPSYNGALIALLLSLLVLVTANILSAQTNDDCLACHSDNTLTMEKNHKTVSLYVDAKVLAHSAHGKLQCISCHVGFDPDKVTELVGKLQ